jgi:hypothetical protein
MGVKCLGEVTIRSKSFQSSQHACDCALAHSPQFPYRVNTLTSTPCTVCAGAAAVLLPGRKVVNITAGTDVTADGTMTVQQTVAPGDATELCPIGFYYDGTEAIYGCKRCPLDSLTKQNGSESVDDW